MAAKTRTTFLRLRCILIGGCNMDSAYYFREKAARCRLLLAVATNPEVREQLRLWVWEFEDRADSAERRGHARRVAAVTPAPIRPRRHAGRARPTAPPAPCRQKVLPPFCVATIRAGPRCRESNPGRGGPCASWRTAWLRRGAGASIISCNARRTQPSSANTNSSAPAPAPAPTEARAVDPDASKRTV